MEDPELVELRKSIEVLESASKVSARSRATNIGPFVEEIIEYAAQNGLKNSELKQLVQILASKNELDQTSCTTLLKNLYPADRVSSEVIITAIGGLGQGSRAPSPASQATLVRWITAIHSISEEPNLIARFYHVLFNSLDFISIRTPICQLLGIITRRKHVRAFRIQKLLSLCQQYGHERALVDLLRVYKNFYPEIIISASPVGRVPLSYYDAEWLAGLRVIQAAAQVEISTSALTPGFKVSRNGEQARKTQAIPELHSFHADEDTVTLEDIQSAQDFVDKLEKIEPPSQIISCLRDPLLQKYKLLQRSDELSRRFEFWLRRYLEDEIELIKEGFGLSASLPDLLNGCLTYTEATKELPEALESFLMTYIEHWDGVTNLGTMIDLTSHLPSRNFQESYEVILRPLERAILNSAHHPYQTLLDFYGKLAQRWIGYFSEDITNMTSEVRRQRRDNYIDLQTHVSTLLLNALAAPEESIPAIIEYVEKICHVTIEALSNSSSTDFPISFVTPKTFYLLLMSSSLSTMSRLCLVLETYYSGKTSMRDRFQRGYLGADAAGLNSYLMDVCNLLYRARALDSKDSVAAGCLCPESAVEELRFYLPQVSREYSLASMFGMSWHPLISAVAASAFREFETQQKMDNANIKTEISHQGPVDQRSLVLLNNEGGINLSWKEYRKLVLRWLTQHGLSGIERLLFAAMKDLAR